MLKPDLIKAVAEAMDLTQVQAAGAVNQTMALIAEAINQHGRFEYPGFGVFKKVTRKATNRPNPQDRSKRVLTPARNTVTFKPSPALKEMVNG